MEAYRELNRDIPEQYQMLRESAHRFAKEVMRPAAVAIDKIPDPEDTISAGSQIREVLKEAYKLGYHASDLPVELDGLGLDGLGMHILLEELSWGAVDLALSILVSAFPFASLAATGDRELIEQYVKPFVADKQASLIGCWAITEPDHGSDTIMVGMPEFKNPKVSGQLVARRDGDDYIISGQKSSWVSNGTMSTHAITYLTVDPSKGMSGGGIAFIPLDLPGVSKGKPLNKLGQRALNQGEIFFDGVRIPRRFMLITDGYEEALTRTLAFANSAMATAFTGLARAAFEEALAYSKTRVQGGKPICEHQLIQKRLFEMFTKVETCRALSRATMIYNHDSPAPSIEHAIAAKTFCTQASFEVASDALQLFGGNGLTKEYPMEKLFRDARASLIEDGTNEVLSLAGARRLLELGNA